MGYMSRLPNSNEPDDSPVDEVARRLNRPWPAQPEAAPKMDVKHCAGCYNDDYNRGLGGAKECWHLKTAQLTSRKRVPVDQPPPWNQASETLPSCYLQTGFVFVRPTQID